VWVRGAKPAVEAVVDTSRQLAFQLQALRLRALVEVLEKNGLHASPGLSKLVATAESKVAMTSAPEPPAEQGVPQ
jgi:hypothetical protein